MTRFAIPDGGTRFAIPDGGTPFAIPDGGMIPRHDYGLFAPLFTYPEADYRKRVRELSARLSSRCPKAAASLDALLVELPGEGDALSDRELDELQELFTRTFEVQSFATLDVGYVAFGDDYKRAELLVNLNRELRAAGIDAGVELSDHLSNVLYLLARWEDGEAATEFTSMILHPSLDKLVREFSPERTAARNALYKKHYKTLIDYSPERATAYRHALEALLEVVRADFDLPCCEQPERTSDFLSSIKRELEIEARGEGHRPSIGRTP